MSSASGVFAAEEPRNDPRVKEGSKKPRFKALGRRNESNECDTCVVMWHSSLDESIS